MTVALADAPSSSDWKEYELGEILTLINGRAYKKEELLDKGTPVLRIQNLNGGKRWYYSNLNLPTNKYCDNGDLLFAWSASFGPYIWGGGKAIYHYHIWKIETGKKLDKKFAYYLLQSITDRVKSAGRGISMLHMTKSGMEAWKVRIPPLAEQKRIAAILDQADAVRTARQRTLDKLNTLGLSIFYEMFGDPATNSMGWDTGTLGEVIYAASDGPHVSPEYAEDGIPFLSTRHVKDGKISWNDLKYISKKEAARQWKKCKPKRGDILYTKGGTTGIAALVDTDVEFAVWVHVALLTPKLEVVDPTWLVFMLNSEFCYHQSQRFTHGIANRDLGLRRMVKIDIFIPDIDKQREFVRVISELNELSENTSSALASEDALFASLQQRAFRGEL